MQVIMILRSLTVHSLRLTLILLLVHMEIIFQFRLNGPLKVALSQQKSASFAI